MNMIVAADRNWGIGRDNKLLVSIPADKRMFREKTGGKVVLMGRKTLQSLPGGMPLKGRTNIVLTTNRNFAAKGVIAVHSLEEALKAIADYDPADVFCIGGDSIYHLMLPYTDTAYVTKSDYAYDADAYFPDLDADPGWHVASEGEEQTYFDLEYRFLRYERV